MSALAAVAAVVAAVGHQFALAASCSPLALLPTTAVKLVVAAWPEVVCSYELLSCCRTTSAKA